MGTRTKVLITAAVVGAVGVLVAVGTSALFSASATSSTNVASTGTLTTAGGTGVYFDSTAGDGLMKPVVGGLAAARSGNVVVSGSTTVTNSGSLAGDYTLKQINVGGTGLGAGTGLVGADPALFSLAQLCVSEAPLTDCGVYNGAFDMGAASTPGTGDSVDSTPIALGTFASGDAKTYDFEVWLPNSAVTDNDYQNQNATAEFQFDAS